MIDKVGLKIEPLQLNVLFPSSNPRIFKSSSSQFTTFHQSFLIEHGRRQTGRNIRDIEAAVVGFRG